MAGMPRFLFVPVSGPGGAGEYYRSLAVARGLERRWPGCRIRFVLNRSASYASSAPYEGLRIDDSPTRASAEVVDYLRSERPDVAVFDSAGRIEQYRAARAVGASVVYVSSRPKTRWKGFRWRRMRLIDQHWIAQPGFLGGAPTPYERFKLHCLGRPEVVTLDALHEPVEPVAVARLQASLGVEPGRYVALCPGGGGDFGHDTDATQVFFEVAQRLVGARTLPVVAVLGPRLSEKSHRTAPAGGLKIVGTLPNGELLGLLREATVAVVNGGSLLLQSMTQGMPIVAAPIAGDQAARIRRCAVGGYVRAAALDPAALTTAITTLLDDVQARESLRSRLGELGLRNGVDIATEAVARLLDAAHAGRAVRP